MANKFWKVHTENGIAQILICRMEDAFPFLIDTGRHIVSIVGAGGKTTLLYTLADDLTKRYQKVLVMTTTHMMKPSTQYYAKTTEEVRKLWKNNRYAVIGVETEMNKIGMLSEVNDIFSIVPEKIKEERKTTEWYALIQQADMILIEADGSKRLPCKAPATHEPVIVAQSDIVIDVVGLSAIGKKIQDCCHRPEQVEKITGKTKQDNLTTVDVAQLVSSVQAGRKYVDNREYYIVLNQCDTEKELSYTRQIVNDIPEQLRTRCIAMCTEI